MNKVDVEHLREAILIAQKAVEHGNHPFGAILVDENDRVVLRAENDVNTSKDATGHAETNLVKLASRQFSAEKLAKCTLYTSTEPCPMCAGAIHWSHIGRVVYALSEDDLYAITGPTPENLLVPCRDILQHSQQVLDVQGPCEELITEARDVHAAFWK
jgi:tRNA(Arg) A34 adenosine deaminase TadA